MGTVNTAISHAALLVDGLALSITSEDLREMLSPYGKVLWTRVVTDRFRRSLSYGYAVMADEADAVRAIDALNGKTLAGRPMSVSRTTVPPLPRMV